VNEEALAHWGAVAPKNREKTKKAYCLNSPFLLLAPICQLKNRGGFREIFQSGKGFHRRKGLKSPVLEENYVHDNIGVPG